MKEGPLRKQMLRSQLWRGIFDAAESDTALKEMLDQVEIYYKLKQQP